MNILNHSGVVHLIDESRGNIPTFFIRNFELNEWNIDPQAFSDLKDPEHEMYWELWQEVLSSAFFENEGQRWTLYQDGSVFALCEELMTDEEQQNFGFSE